MFPPAIFPAPNSSSDPETLAWWYALLLGAVWDAEGASDIEACGLPVASEGCAISICLVAHLGGLSMASLCCRFGIAQEIAERITALMDGRLRENSGLARRFQATCDLYRELLGEVPARH